MRIIKTQKSFHIALAAFMAVSGVLSVGMATQAHAAGALSKITVRFDRMLQSQPTTGMICATPATTSTDVKTWNVVFPTGFSVGLAATWNSNISVTGIPSGTTAWPNAASATATVATNTVTWTNSSAQTMNSGTTYCYYWTSTTAITQASSATASEVGSVTTTNSSSATIDTGQYATATVSQDTISVNATVPAIFTFALANTSDTITGLSSAAVGHSTTAPTATIGTNAKNGWQVWAKDATTGMVSAAASKTIASTTPGTNSTLTAGTEGYNTGVTSSHAAGTGAITVDTAFVGGTSIGGGLNTTFARIASSNGTATSDVLTLTNNLAISNATPAANDYTDTITVVGAGLF